MHFPQKEVEYFRKKRGKVLVFVKELSEERFYIEKNFSNAILRPQRNKAGEKAAEHGKGAE